jgi:RimJ/RimL family protein N-acetyltransferase
LEAVILKLSRCTVRPWAESDAKALIRHADDREVWRNVRDRFPHPYTAADAENWLTFATRQDPPMHFAIEVDGEAAGGIGFTIGEDVHARTAEIGYWLGRAVWGRGIATEALSAVTAHAFAAHPLDRLQACVFAWNPASVRVLEKAGYVREALLRRAVTKDGETTDMLIYGILRPEPLAPRSAPL